MHIEKRKEARFIVGIKKNWAEESNLYKNKEGVVMSTVSTGEKKVIIKSVYNRRSWKNLEEKLKRIEENEERVISGDFNVRTGELSNVE